MSYKNTVPDFQNQTIYVGMDVHLKSWQVTFRSAGMVLGTHSMEPDPEKLCSYLHRQYSNGIYKSAYEAGFCGFWIHRKLVSLGIENIIINPADIPTSGKEKVQKTDIVDSKKIARELENGTLTGIYIPTEYDESFRSLNRLRLQYTRDMVRQKNRIKAMLHRLGLALPPNHEMKHWSKRFLEHLKTLPFREKTDKMVMDMMLQTLMKMREELVSIVLQLRALVAENEVTRKTVEHLLSVPGVGVITAMTLKAELIDITRFRHLDDLSSYVGLVPAIHDSGETSTTLGISNRHMPYVRNMLIESSWTAVRKDPALLASYSNLIKRMTKAEAIIRIAKKLLNRIMTVWKHQTDYVHAVVV